MKMTKKCSGRNPKMYFMDMVVGGKRYRLSTGTGNYKTAKRIYKKVAGLLRQQGG